MRGKKAGDWDKEKLSKNRNKDKFLFLWNLEGRMNRSM